MGKRGESNFSQKAISQQEKKENSSSPSSSTPPPKEIERPTKEEWAVLTAKLCFQKTPQNTELRQKLFNKLDTNGNGYLSLAELEKGIRDELKLPKIFASKQPILRSFQVLSSFSRNFSLSISSFSKKIYSPPKRWPRTFRLLLRCYPMTLLNLKSFDCS